MSLATPAVCQITRQVLHHAHVDVAKSLRPPKSGTPGWGVFSTRYLRSIGRRVEKVVQVRGAADSSLKNFTQDADGASEICVASSGWVDRGLMSRIQAKTSSRLISASTRSRSRLFRIWSKCSSRSCVARSAFRATMAWMISECSSARQLETVEGL